MITLKKESVFYSDNFKRKVLTSIRDGEMSAYQAGRHFGIKGSITVYRWIDRQDKIFGITFAETTKNNLKNEDIWYSRYRSSTPNAVCLKSLPYPNGLSMRYFLSV